MVDNFARLQGAEPPDLGWKEAERYKSRLDSLIKGLEEERDGFMRSAEVWRSAALSAPDGETQARRTARAESAENTVASLSKLIEEHRDA
jgi:hypothetical protein